MSCLLAEKMVRSMAARMMATQRCVLAFHAMPSALLSAPRLALRSAEVSAWGALLERNSAMVSAAVSWELQSVSRSAVASLVSATARVWA